MNRSHTVIALLALAACLGGCATAPSGKPSATTAAVSTNRLDNLNAKLADQSEQAQRQAAGANGPGTNVAVVNQHTSGGQSAGAAGGFQAARASFGGSSLASNTLLQRIQAQDQLQKVLRQSQAQSASANGAVAVRTSQTPAVPQVKATTF